MPKNSRYIAVTSFLCTLAGGATASAQPVLPFTRTLVVADTGNPALNGTNLLNAVAFPPAPGPGSRWLVVVEPGTYDLGASTLSLRNFVDVQGSGRNSTIIRSSAPTVVVAPVGVDVELRDLTVAGDGRRTGSAVGIRIETPEMKLTTVNVEITAPTDATGVLVNAAGRPRLSAVFPRVSTSSRGGRAIGLEVSRSEGVIVNEMFVFILSGGQANFGILLSANTGESILDIVSGLVAVGRENTGIFIDGGTQARITNNQWTVDGFGRSTIGTGVFNAGTANIKGSTFTVSNATQDSAVVNRRGVLSLQSVVASAPTTPTSVVAPIALDLISGSAEVNQSVLKAKLALQTAVGTVFNAGSTKLDGARSVAGASRCSQSYDDTFTDIPNGPC